MNLVTPFEQAAAEALTGLIITGGQNKDPVKINKRAQTALAVATAITGLTTGNAAPAIAALQQVLANADLDPGVALAVQGVFALAQQQLQLTASLASLIPLSGATAEAVAANVAAGVAAAAQAEIKAYPLPAA